MRRTALIFPDTSSLADFIFKHCIQRAEVASHENTLTALLSDQQIVDACTVFKAEMKPEYFFGQFTQSKGGKIR